MSTEHATAELYRLSISQAGHYCRKPECSAVRNMEGYARILEDAGVEVIDVHGTWLEVKTTQGKVWTALSGLSW